jgi:hypothetical protein
MKKLLTIAGPERNTHGITSGLDPYGLAAAPALGPLAGRCDIARLNSNDNNPMTFINRLIASVGNQPKSRCFPTK